VNWQVFNIDPNGHRREEHPEHHQFERLGSGRSAAAGPDLWRLHRSAAEHGRRAIFGDLQRPEAAGLRGHHHHRQPHNGRALSARGRSGRA
jgi:hypothetical protein